METLGGNSSSSPSLSSASSSSSFGGINTDDNNGGVTWYGMRLPVNPFLSPISFLLDYSGILRSSNDSEGMIVNNGVSGSELRSQVDAGGAVAGSSAGEVAIRIIGAGENIHNQVGEVGYDDCGEELIGERSGMPGLGENDAEGRGGIEASEGVPLVSSSSSSSLAGSGQVDGEAAGNGTENNRDSSSHQRYDIQLVAKWIEQILPFSLLLLVVFIRQHLQGFFVTIWIAAVMFKSNEIVKKQTALKGDRKVSLLAGIAFAFILHVICIYWWYRNDDILYPLAMLPPNPTPFWHAIFTILVNDILMRQVAMAFKCILLIYYKKGKGHNFRRQAQMLTLVEYTLLLYRALLPTPVWYRFFLNREYGSLFSSLTTGLYLTFKLTSVVEKVQCFISAPGEEKRPPFLLPLYKLFIHLFLLLALRLFHLLQMSMASSISIPAPEAIQVLLSLLADDSSSVRESSMSSLNDLAALNPVLVLECCAAVSRGGRRRFGNIAGVFQVMAVGVRALDERDVDSAFMAKLAKIATSEMISSKELNSDWQRAATSLLVAIGSHLPDLVMEEIFLHLTGTSSALQAMVQILAEFASSSPLLFIPRWKGVLSRILPILGNVRDMHRPTFANAFKCWCQAAWQYSTDFPSNLPQDGDVMSFLNSAFELLLRVWAASRDLKVRVASVEALGQMVGLITRTQLKAALPRLVPTILDLYKKDLDVAFLATCSLHNLLNASLLSESGPPMLDFEDLTLTLGTLLPVVSMNSESKDQTDFSVGLKMYNEVQHCFLTVGLVYPDDLFLFLVNKCRLKEETSTFGALCVLKHLLPRLSEAWHSKIPLLVEAVKSLLEEHNLGVRKALSELIVVMASHCYLVGSSGELFIEYLIRHCALTDKNQSDLDSIPNKRIEMKIGAVTPGELRTVCEKGLLLVTITIPEMEHILWPFLLKMIIPQTYTGAVAMVCRCISELWRHRSYGSDMLSECKTRPDIPTAEELLARFVVLLHDPLAREQLATQILTVLCLLAPLFPKNINLFWQDEIPKMKAYVSDTDDLKQDPSYQDTWDDMIINFLAESLDVIQDADWIMSLGNVFAKHYELYTSDDEHAALLHRCLGILLQKVNDRAYVHDKMNWMYKQSNIAIPTNRLGLAKAMGLVAASHLDTVLEKLKDIIDNVGQTIIQRILSLFSDSYRTVESDDIHAALALMYGYAAKYAPSSVIEARINALVGTNMLSRLLHVRHPIAKQAVITAIDLLGNAVINAAESGAPFPLKRRDQLLDYILTLMGRDDNDGFVDYNELLRTQALAISACTTLVTVEPKLTVETRNYVMKATLGFFAIQNDPVEVVTPLIDNLISLLCAILLTGGEDGRSRAELLMLILRQIDQFVSSPVEYQRKRGCLAVHEMLLKFRMVCVTGYCALGSHGNSAHTKQIDRTLYGNFSKLPSAFVLPNREALCLGDRVIMYLPRCADTNSEVRKISAQILDQLFSISLSLPKPPGLSVSAEDIELSYRALSSLEDVIAMLRNDTSIDPSEVFNRIISSLCILLTRDELVAMLHGCSVAICDKIKQSAEGAIQAVVEFVTRRGSELTEIDISRTTQSLISAAVHATDKHLRVETLGAIACLAESTSAKTVFDEVLATAGKDIVTKDISRLRGGWPMQDAFYAFSQHMVLSVLFLEHVISVLSHIPMLKCDVDRVEDSQVHNHTEDGKLEAAIFALTAFFRGGGKVGKRAVEQNYASVLSELMLQLGSCHGLASSGHLEPLRNLLTAFQAFCECVGDLEMGKILARDGELSENERWISLIGDIAGCISIKRPKEIQNICQFLKRSLDRPQKYQREAAAAALSEFVRYSGGLGSLLEQMVDVVCRRVSDESSTVRRFCLRGLVQIPSIHILKYTAQVLGVILALLDDSDESVQLTAVSCLLMILESSPDDAVEPILLNLSIRLRNLQTSMNAKMRASSFAVFGALSNYGIGELKEAFVEQVHAAIPRLVLHLHDEDVSVRLACRNTLRRVFPLMEIEGLLALLNTPSFLSDHRSDYEDFLRDIAKQFTQHLLSRVDTYMASTVQAFDAPWPIIQANAMYLSSSMLSLSDSQHILADYHTQVFGMLVGKMSRSPDAIVRATCSAALGLLLKSSNSCSWRAVHLDRLDSTHSTIRNHDTESMIIN